MLILTCSLLLLQLDISFFLDYLSSLSRSRDCGIDFVSCSKLEETSLDVGANINDTEDGRNADEVVSARYSYVSLYNLTCFNAQIYCKFSLIVVKHSEL